MRPIQTILVLEAVRDSFSRPLYRKEEELSSNDRGTVMDVYLQWLLLMIDLGYLHHESLERDSRRLLTDMVEKDVLDLNNAFAELLGKVRTQDIRGFKALCGSISTHLYSFIKKDVVRIPDGDVYAGSRLVQLTSYTSRLSLNDIDLTQSCLDSYMETENGILDYYPNYLTTFLNNVIKKWFKSFDPERIHRAHGPGGVAGHGRVSAEVKYRDLTSDTMLSYAFGDPDWIHSPIPSNLDRISQTIFVPKSYKTFRTISMEPATLMFFQQGIWGEIDRVVASSRWLKSRIGFHEQERNQELARKGSLERTYATIDLSAASDSVSYELVKRCFRGTKLLRYLVTTRSKRTLLPDGRLINLKKFAPMGSALCFPVETIIFAAICHLVTREHGVTGDFSVFGDDIIVPTQCAEDVMNILVELGFSPNREKSFYDPTCWFRESCGAEYVDGFDVTPMRVSRKYAHTARDVRATGFIDSANSAYQRGFKNLRQFFLRKLQEVEFVPLFGPEHLQGDNYTNYHTLRRWNSDLQKIEAKTTSVVAKSSKNQDEALRLRHWFESTFLRLPRKRGYSRDIWEEGFVADVSRKTVLLKERWNEKPFELPDQEFYNFFTIEGRI